MDFCEDCHDKVLIAWYWNLYLDPMQCTEAGWYTQQFGVLVQQSEDGKITISWDQNYAESQCCSGPSGFQNGHILSSRLICKFSLANASTKLRLLGGIEAVIRDAARQVLVAIVEPLQLWLLSP